MYVCLFICSFIAREIVGQFWCGLFNWIAWNNESDMEKNIFFQSKNWPKKRGKTSFLQCADLKDIINNIVLVRDADLREVIKTWHQATKDHLKQFKQQYHKVELQLTAQYKYLI